MRLISFGVNWLCDCDSDSGVQGEEHAVALGADLFPILAPGVVQPACAEGSELAGKKLALLEATKQIREYGQPVYRMEEPWLPGVLVPRSTATDGQKKS